MEKTAAKRHQEKTHTEISTIILALKWNLAVIEATTLRRYAVSTFFAVPAVLDQKMGHFPETETEQVFSVSVFFFRNRTPKDLAKRSGRAPADFGSPWEWVGEPD